MSQGQAAELWLGPACRSGSSFRSSEHLAAVWQRHRDRIMSLWGRHGRRPQAWWECEAPIAFPGYSRERSTLWQAGLLTEEERAELEGFWRQQFERTYQPDFAYVDRPGRIYQGAAARRRHYAWADIPEPLVAVWSCEMGEGTPTTETHGSERADAAVLVEIVEGEEIDDRTEPSR